MKYMSCKPTRRDRRRSTRRGVVFAAGTAAIVLTAGACGSSSAATPPASSQVPASAKQTIVFATDGLGSEGKATDAAVAAFEKANPNIHVQVLALSPTSNVALNQLDQRFISGSSTPDVIYLDVIRPVQFAQSGWLANLNKFHVPTSTFFPAQMATGEYKGGVYAVPWFINAEGVYYRTDLVKTPPKTPAQLVADARSLLATHPSLKEGFAFEGAEYEGAVTAFQSMGGNIASSTLSNINNSSNLATLTFMYDAIHKYHISPSAVTTWEESNVQNAWLSGQTPFALNWPYLFQLSEAAGSPVAGKTGWIPFPSATGKPQASLGGADLAINAKSTHQAAAWKFIQYLTSIPAQVTRAINAGDPPSVKAAYTAHLYSVAPYYRQEQAVYAAAVPRPITPVYSNISTDIQTMISSVLAGQESPAAALKSTAPQVAQLQATVR